MSNMPLRGSFYESYAPMRTQDIRNLFRINLRDENFVVDKTGVKVIEQMGASFIANEPSIFGEPNDDYIHREFDWYYSNSTNINDIYGGDRSPPKAWEYSANKHGEINSNYGLLLFGEKYNEQYNCVLQELLANPNSRRATAVYNRPSIWVEYDENGKNDFICTNAVTYYIRDNRLCCVVQMRSNDVIYGYNNDYAWQKNVLDMLLDDLNSYQEDYYQLGEIHWQVQSLHIYEKHFGLIEKYFEEFEKEDD